MRWLIRKYNTLGVFDKVLVLIAVFVISFLGYVFFRKSEFVTVTIKVGEENVHYEPWMVDTGTRAWFAQLFSQGMEETDGLGRVMAEVLSVRSYDTQPSRKAVYVTTKLNTVFSKSSNQYTFKGRPLLIGSTVKLNLDRLLVEGLITHVEGVKDARVKETIIVEAQIREETPTFPETSGTRDYIAQALIIGEEIKDSQENTIIKILDKRVENAKRVVTTSDGKVLVQTNPLRKDVFLTLEISAIKIGERYYLFDDIPILIGYGIPFNTSTLSVLPEVTRFVKVR